MNPLDSVIGWVPWRHNQCSAQSTSTKLALQPWRFQTVWIANICIVSGFWEKEHPRCPFLWSREMSSCLGISPIAAKISSPVSSHFSSSLSPWDTSQMRCIGVYGESLAWTDDEVEHQLLHKFLCDNFSFKNALIKVSHWSWDDQDHPRACPPWVWSWPSRLIIVKQAGLATGTNVPS